MQKIAIIGLGLIGGSIGLALKQAGIGDVQIAGVARSRKTADEARKRGAIDIAARSPAEAVRDAKLVIVATPILAVRSTFEEIAPALAEGAVVTDAASTKSGVMRWARELLPAHVQYVGGHPMAGKEQAGIAAADAELFRDKPWVIVPSVDCTESAVHTVMALADACGARALFMDADEHDSYVAAVSHLPLTLSAALFSVVFESQAWPELAGLASSGFRDTTRLASGSPEMAHDIMVTNRDNVVHWIDRMQQRLAEMREKILAGDSETLMREFTRPQIERDQFMVAGPPRRESEDAQQQVPGIGELLMGAKLSEFMRKQQQMVKDAEQRLGERK